MPPPPSLVCADLVAHTVESSEDGSSRIASVTVTDASAATVTLNWTVTTNPAPTIFTIRKSYDLVYFYELETGTTTLHRRAAWGCVLAVRVGPVPRPFFVRCFFVCPRGDARTRH